MLKRNVCLLCLLRLLHLILPLQLSLIPRRPSLHPFLHPYHGRITQQPPCLFDIIKPLLRSLADPEPRETGLLAGKLTKELSNRSKDQTNHGGENDGVRGNVTQLTPDGPGEIPKVNRFTVRDEIRLPGDRDPLVFLVAFLIFVPLRIRTELVHLCPQYWPQIGLIHPTAFKALCSQQIRLCRVLVRPERPSGRSGDTIIAERDVDSRQRFAERVVRVGGPEFVCREEVGVGNVANVGEVAQVGVVANLPFGLAVFHDTVESRDHLSVARTENPRWTDRTGQQLGPAFTSFFLPVSLQDHLFSSDLCLVIRIQWDSRIIQPLVGIADILLARVDYTARRSVDELGDGGGRGEDGVEEGTGTGDIDFLVQCTAHTVGRGSSMDDYCCLRLDTVIDGC